MKLLLTIIERKLVIFLVLRAPYWIRHYWDRQMYYKMTENIQPIEILYFQRKNSMSICIRIIQKKYVFLKISTVFHFLKSKLHGTKNKKFSRKLQLFCLLLSIVLNGSSSVMNFEKIDKKFFSIFLVLFQIKSAILFFYGMETQLWSRKSKEHTQNSNNNNSLLCPYDLRDQSCVSMP